MKPPASVPALLLPLLLALAPIARAALVSVGDWTPLFQGVDLASGSQQAQSFAEPDHQVLCVRVDLTDPGVSLFATPRCDACALDTLSENTSHFVEQYGVQVAVNGAFYGRSGGATDTPVGTPDNILGLAISQGTTVSAADSRYAATLLFTESKQAFYLPYNTPPTNTAGIHTALSGNRPLLIGGNNVQTANPFDRDPRTALGLSADRRYLYLLTLDGRQPGWSDGADFRDTGEWLKRFGASDGINVDGGGSTTMVMADCLGVPVRLNRSSYVAAYGRERVIGHNFGIRARPLDTGIRALSVEPASTTALLTWETDLPATTSVAYGPDRTYGQTTPPDSHLGRRHVATLTELQPGTTYEFQAVSVAAGVTHTQACRFTTAGSLEPSLVFDLTQEWAFTTNNLDGTAWTTVPYDDSGWLGRGPGLLCVENSPSVAPKNTVLPPDFGQLIPRTYYFRTRFTWDGPPDGVSLVLSNYVDDGAVFHLNGREVYRLRMPEAPEVITSRTLASGFACTGTASSGDANTSCPDVFTLNPDVVGPLLVPGDNVLGVEVHNYTDGSIDIVFGGALIANTPARVLPRLQYWLEDGIMTLFWNEEGFTLQQAGQLGPADAWSDIPGPVTRSPVHLPLDTTTYYRLRR